VFSSNGFLFLHIFRFFSGSPPSAATEPHVQILYFRHRKQCKQLCLLDLSAPQRILICLCFPSVPSLHKAVLHPHAPSEVLPPGFFLYFHQRSGYVLVLLPLPIPGHAEIPAALFPLQCKTVVFPFFFQDSLLKSKTSKMFFPASPHKY